MQYWDMWFSKKNRVSNGGRIYLDYASAPPVSDEALSAMQHAFAFVGNPGAIHQEAVEAKRSLEHSRELIARALSCKTREVIFTSGLTESNNLAIVGCARSLERKRRSLTDTHWIVSSIEHSSILASFGEVERMGATVSYAEPDAGGIIQPEAIEALLTAQTVFVSVGWANNEIGTIQPLSRIARSLAAAEKKHGSTIFFHSDAGQAPLYLATTVHSLGVDMLSLGSNKMYGPHGCGALYLSNRTDLAPVMYGGPQERALRAGTENVALAAGFAAAFDEVTAVRHEESKRLQSLRDVFAKSLQENIPGLVVNGDTKHVLPHMLNISIPNIQSEYVTLSLDRAGIAVSTKSACREGEESRSHVVEALGAAPHSAMTKEMRASNTLRFSLGRKTTSEDLVRVVDSLKNICTRLH